MSRLKLPSKLAVVVIAGAAAASCGTHTDPGTDATVAQLDAAADAPATDATVDPGDAIAASDADAGDLCFDIFYADGAPVLTADGSIQRVC